MVKEELTLTEDDIDVGFNMQVGSEHKYYGLNIGFKGTRFTLPQAEWMKQQILQALEENPNLRKRLDNALQMISTKEGEVIKLKAEIEELKKENERLEYVADKILDSEQALQKENSQLNKLLDEVPVLRGKDAEAFEEYANRVPTQEELDYVKRCDEFYKKHDPEQIELTKLKELKQRIENYVYRCTQDGSTPSIYQLQQLLKSQEKN